MIRPRLAAVALALALPSCADEPRAPDPVRVVRGVAPLSPVSRRAPISPSSTPPPVPVAVVRFDAATDALEERAQTAARRRDLYRIQDTILADAPTPPTA